MKSESEQVFVIRITAKSAMATITVIINKLLLDSFLLAILMLSSSLNINEDITVLYSSRKKKCAGQNRFLDL